LDIYIVFVVGYDGNKDVLHINNSRCDGG